MTRDGVTLTATNGHAFAVSIWLLIRDQYMPLFRKQSKCPPIGLTIDDGQVRLAQVQLVQDGGIHFATASTPIESGLSELVGSGASHITQAIKAARATGGFVGKKVVSCLPKDDVQLLRLRLPLLADTELQQAVQQQASKKLGLPADAIQSDYYKVGEVGHGEKTHCEVIAVAARVEDLIAYDRLVSASGLDLVAVDTCDCALARVLQLGLDPTLTSTPILALHIDGSQALLINIRDNELSFARLICSPDPIGGTAVSSTVSKHLGDDFTAEPSQGSITSSANVGHATRMIAREIEQAIHHLNSIDTTTPGRVYVIASHNEPDTVAALNTASSLVFTSLSDAWSQLFSSGFDTIKNSPSPTPWLVGLGLSMHGWEQVFHREAA